MKSLFLKIAYIVVFILLPSFGFGQKSYVKDFESANDACLFGNYFDAIELYKKVYTEEGNNDRITNIIDHRPMVICKIADCYRNLCDFKQTKQWYRKAIKCNCMDSITAQKYINEADSNIKGDTVLQFVRYATCDDCNEGYYITKSKNPTVSPSSEDTCHFSMACMKIQRKDTVMHIDSATLVRNGKCTYMLDAPQNGKDVRYWLFKGDASGRKVRSLYFREIFKKQNQYGMDVTYLPADTYLFFIYTDTSRQEYIIHLK